MTSTASILAAARIIEDMNRMEEFLEEEERIRRVLGEDERTKRLLKDFYLDSEGKEMFQAQQRLNLALSRQRPRSRSSNTTPTTSIVPSHTPIEANNAVIKVIPQQTEPKTQATPVRAIEPSGKDSLEFIRLATVVARIANCVQLEPHLDDNATAIGDISRAAADKFWKENNPKIEWARSFGVAASMLNKALHDSNMPPQWMEFDNQKRFAVKNDAVKQEGIELLTHATGWGNREQGNYSLHFFNAITQGEDALAMPIARGLNDGLAPDGKMLRFLNIGFDRAELVAFLDKNQIGHNLTPSPAPVPQDVPVVTDFTLLATREDLIEAFKSFTGMNICWFENLKDSPKLLEARKIKGISGKNNSGPLFCPYEVMLWLIDPKRKKGRKLSNEKAWELLKSHFPKVYNLKSIGSPNPD